MRGIPNLFQELPQREAQNWYSLYLAHLNANHRDRRLLEACKQIRQYAARAQRAEWAYFTYPLEIEALCKLGNIPGAWRQLRRWERGISGGNLNINAKAWTSTQLGWFFSYHPQLLYMLGKYRQARRMFEALLSNLLRRHQPGISYDILWRVYKPVARPRLPHEVTLHHVYQKLGKKLLDWPQWEQFVNGFDPKLFDLAHIQRERLLRDASLLRPFYEAIKSEREQRLTANISTGEREVIDAPEEVERFQDEVAAQQALQEPIIVQRERQLREMFPELQRLR